MSELEEKVLRALEERALAKGIDIVDVEITGSGSATCVCVRIDYADESLPTISLDEVASQSQWIGDTLDELDPISSSYSLEVSSPGMDRPLRRPHDFQRFAGQTVRIETTALEGRRKYTGQLLGFDQGSVLIQVDNDRFELPLEEIKRAKIKPTYDFSQKKKG